MNLSAVMEEIADKLKLFAGVSAFGFPTDSLVPPAAVVGYPERIEYDVTYQRGEDMFWNLPVWMVTDRTDSKSARNKLSEWTDPTSSNSVKTFLDKETYASCGSVVVVNAEFDMFDIAGVSYAVAQFELNVSGEGT